MLLVFCDGTGAVLRAGVVLPWCVVLCGDASAM